ncbi:DoxX family membrane protein [Cutibacterium sp. WCA-380-WT-3A]|uniref:DoxX family membrane protein n=1 Tax=Cutibacterium porci TaxID=2605781 RepID=A0A7K0J9B3_9ACTN|nr:DoxX family protein [Cutibacterium porci]MSS46562.1 DoxX family membrane protein [Cutibacterium porci]
MAAMDSQPSPRSTTVRDWVGLAARIILGGTLLVAGIIKATDIDSAIWSVRTYQIIPWNLAPIVGWTMPILEIIVGLLLIFGIATRWSGLLGTLAMVVFIAAIASAWARHISLDCGCFGDGGPVDQAWPETVRSYILDMLRDLGLALCGIWLVIRPRSALSVDRWIVR